MKMMKMMKMIRILPLKRFALGNDIKPLGRWSIDYCPKKINRKVNLANEDNCGVCDQYKNTNTNNIKPLRLYNLSIEELEILFNASVI